MDTEHDHTHPSPRPLVLVTGANRGLGRAVATALAQRGYGVLVAARRSRDAEDACRDLRAARHWADPVVLDVTSQDSVTEAAEEVRRSHGRLDVLVNNAGILPEATAPDAAQPMDADLFRHTFDVNLFGAVRTTQAFLPLLRVSADARIVNVSSRMGSLTDQGDPRSPYHSMVLPAYQTSKAALNGVTVAMAKALRGDGIRVSSVCPGWVRTDLGGAANRAAAPTSAAEAAEVVADVVTGDLETGGFHDASGTIAW
ncbi:SDR family NAD(P)-dependent oxidoreductase [Nocardioides sp. S-58]|uniref:SDR family NAD(P)-dependent oxidoreductase n=1 Tax=Nocardioides renjunii TaxID=3095075 RepID=A0ABU5KAJ6_9ACTN|nr:SDR family NAD(P)-dependent oxidoreductase [Nocardioides sp. S-58]MDZ5661449.1 SDR family NAD(P)-dependent oxidoreductase [Nocardioides sp. S-58]